MSRANNKPGRHLPPGHPQLDRVHQWVQFRIHTGHYHCQMVGNFDQVWSLVFRPSQRTLQKQSVSETKLETISIRRIRHVVERCLNIPYSEAMGQCDQDDRQPPTVHVQGGAVGHSPVDGYRVPRTLTTLSWADGSLGRAFVSCRSDSLTERQRLQANKEIK